MRKSILLILALLLSVPSVQAMFFGGDEPGCRADPHAELFCVLEEGRTVDGKFTLVDLDDERYALLRVEGYLAPYNATRLGDSDHMVYTNPSDGSRMILTIFGTGFSNNSREAIMMRFKPVGADDMLYGDGIYCLTAKAKLSGSPRGITYLENGKSVTKTDYCVDRHTRYQYYCGGSQPVACRESEICKGGECVFHPSFGARLQAWLWMTTMVLKSPFR